MSYNIARNGSLVPIAGNPMADIVPVATDQDAGIVKPDGVTITVDQYGTITANAGHTVVDESGVSLTQRSKLKFVNLNVSDDSTNDQTIVKGETIQVDTLPTASADELGHVYQYLGTTTSDYTHGYFYECKEDSGNYFWENVPVQTDKGTTIIQKPTVTVGTYTYNGTEQGPTIVWATGMADNCIVTNAKKTNAGTYTLTIALKNTNTMVWNDLTTADLTYSYIINKATGSITLNPTSVTINASGKTATSTATIIGDGVVTVTNNNTSIYNMSYNSETGVITITDKDETSGTGTVTVDMAASTNYTADSATLNVTATFKPDLVSWSSGTDAQIQAMLDAYYDGVITLEEVQSVWSIGDTRTISLSAMSATGVGESHRAQNVQMEILGFNHDTLSNSVGTAGKTKALISVEQKTCLMAEGINDTNGSSNSEHGYMNSSNTNVGGWTNCARRTWCNSVYYNALPNGFKTMVKQVNKLTSAGNQSSTIDTTADYIWLPSEIEIFGTVTYSKSGEGTQYAWYANSTSNRNKSPHWISSAVSDRWWERSPDGSYATDFCIVSGNGNANYGVASDAYGLAPACCL